MRIFHYIQPMADSQTLNMTDYMLDHPKRVHPDGWRLRHKSSPRVSSNRCSGNHLRQALDDMLPKIIADPTHYLDGLELVNHTDSPAFNSLWTSRTTKKTEDIQNIKPILIMREKIQNETRNHGLDWFKVCVQNIQTGDYHLFSLNNWKWQEIPEELRDTEGSGKKYTTHAEGWFIHQTNTLTADKDFWIHLDPLIPHIE